MEGKRKKKNHPTELTISSNESSIVFLYFVVENPFCCHVSSIFTCTNDLDSSTNPLTHGSVCILVLAKNDAKPFDVLSHILMSVRAIYLSIQRVCNLLLLLFLLFDDDDDKVKQKQKINKTTYLNFSSVRWKCAFFFFFLSFWWEYALGYVYRFVWPRK